LTQSGGGSDAWFALIETAMELVVSTLKGQAIGDAKTKHGGGMGSDN